MGEGDVTLRERLDARIVAGMTLRERFGARLEALDTFTDEELVDAVLKQSERPWTNAQSELFDYAAPRLAEVLRGLGW